MDIYFSERALTVKEGGGASDDLVVKLYCKRSVKKDMLVREGEISVNHDDHRKMSCMMRQQSRLIEGRQLEITLVSAENLPDVRALGLMRVYAKVSLKGESKTTKKSTVDNEGRTNPRWNFAVDYTVSESTVRQPGVNVVVKLLCKRTLGDRLVGEVKIPVKNLFDKGLKSERLLSYPVTGTPEGRLNLLYSFSERILVRQPCGWKTALKTFGLLDSDHGSSGGDDEEEDDCVEVLDGDVYHDAL